MSGGGAIGAVWGGVGGGARGLALRLSQAREAQDFAARNRTLSTALRGSLTREAAPDALAGALEESSRALAQPAYIPAQAALDMRGEGRDILTPLGISVEQAQRAAERGGDLEVRLSELHARLTPEDMEAVADVLRETPEAPNAAEASRVDAAAQAKQAVEEARRGLRRAADMRREESRLAREMEAVTGSRRVAESNAKLFAARASAFAYAYGADPVELMRNVRVEAGTAENAPAEAGGALFQPTREEIRAGDEALKRDAAAWRESMDAITPGVKPERRPRLFSQTPLVMRLIGRDTLSKKIAGMGGVYAGRHLFDGTHPEMTKDMWKQLPEAMADPIAIFDSATEKNRKNGDIVFMVEIQDANGATVVVPVALDVPYGRRQASINILKSAYTKNDRKTGTPRDGWFLEQLENGNARYVNGQKLQRWILTSATSFASAPYKRTLIANAAGNKVVTEADLVKLREANPTLYQLASGPARAYPDNGREVGSIAPDIAARLRLDKPGPIVLDDTGLRHIEDRHGDQIRASGFSSVPEFVNFVLTYFDALYEGNQNNSYELVCREKEPFKKITVKLQFERVGEFYRVSNAQFIRAASFKKRTPLWEKAPTFHSESSETEPYRAYRGQSGELRQSAADVSTVDASGGGVNLAAPTPRGSVTFGPGGSAVIRLFKGADLSSIPHEAAHVFVEDLLRVAESDGALARQRLAVDMEDAGIDPADRQRLAALLDASGTEAATVEAARALLREAREERALHEDSLAALRATARAGRGKKTEAATEAGAQTDAETEAAVAGAREASRKRLAHVRALEALLAAHVRHLEGARRAREDMEAFPKSPGTVEKEGLAGLRRAGNERGGRNRPVTVLPAFRQEPEAPILVFLVLLEPAHHAAQFAAHMFDLMIGLIAAGGKEHGVAGAGFKNEVARELAALDVLQHGLHFLFYVFRDQAGTGDIVAVFGGVADGVAHTGKTALVHEIDDELHFVHAFEVGHFGLVASFHQRFETGLDEGGNAAAENGLFAKEVGFRLFAEGGLNDAGARAANAFGIGQRHLQSFAGGVLLNGHEAGHAAAFRKGAAHEMTGPLGCDQEHVHIPGRNDLIEVDVEAVREEQRLALGEVRLDVVLIDGGLHFVGQKQHDEIGHLGRFLRRDRFKAVLPGQFVIGAAGALTHNNLHAGIAQVLGMGMTLAAIPDDGYRLVFQHIEIGVFVIIDFHQKHSFAVCRLSPQAGRRRKNLFDRTIAGLCPFLRRAALLSRCLGAQVAGGNAFQVSGHAIAAPLPARVFRQGCAGPPADGAVAEQVNVARGGDMEEIAVLAHGFLAVGVGVKKPREHGRVLSEHFAGGVMTAAEGRRQKGRQALIASQHGEVDKVGDEVEILDARHGPVVFAGGREEGVAAHGLEEGGDKAHVGIARVRIGNDGHGMWITGADTRPEQGMRAHHGAPPVTTHERHGPLLDGRYVGHGGRWRQVRHEGAEHAVEDGCGHAEKDQIRVVTDGGEGGVAERKIDPLSGNARRAGAAKKQGTHTPARAHDDGAARRGADGRCAGGCRNTCRGPHLRGEGRHRSSSQRSQKWGKDLATVSGSSMRSRMGRWTPGSSESSASDMAIR